MFAPQEVLNRRILEKLPEAGHLVLFFFLVLLKDDTGVIENTGSSKDRSAGPDSESDGIGGTRRYVYFLAGDVEGKIRVKTPNLSSR